MGTSPNSGGQTKLPAKDGLEVLTSAEWVDVCQNGG
jgi:hypothetical protein